MGGASKDNFGRSSAGLTFDDSLRDPAAQEALMVKKNLEGEVRVAELAAQREVVAQPRVQGLGQCARARCLHHGLTRRQRGALLELTSF